MKTSPKQTFWEHLTSSSVSDVSVPQLSNPLKTKVWSSISIDLEQYKDELLIVKDIRDVVRNINGKEHHFVDYSLETKDGNKLRLRVYPSESGCKILLLYLYDDLIFDEDLLKTCQDSQEFYVTDHDNREEESTYWRIGAVKTHQSCKVLMDEGGKNHIEYKMDFWDYSRVVKDEANQNIEQFLFVEIDKDSGRFQIWRGVEVLPSRITVL